MSILVGFAGDWCLLVSSGTRYIKRIVRYIKKIIELKGGNKYREGAIEVQRRIKAPKARENKWEDI